MWVIRVLSAGIKVIIINIIIKFRTITSVDGVEPQKSAAKIIEKILKIYEEIRMPERATVGSAGYDFYSRLWNIIYLKINNLMQN